MGDIPPLRSITAGQTIIIRSKWKRWLAAPIILLFASRPADVPQAPPLLDCARLVRERQIGYQDYPPLDSEIPAGPGTTSHSHLFARAEAARSQYSNFLGGGIAIPPMRKFWLFLTSLDKLTIMYIARLALHLPPLHLDLAWSVLGRILGSLPLLLSRVFRVKSMISCEVPLLHTLLWLTVRYLTWKPEVLALHRQSFRIHVTFTVPHSFGLFLIAV